MLNLLSETTELLILLDVEFVIVPIISLHYRK